MKIDDIKRNLRYEIDKAPLVASPEASGRTFTGVVHHVNGDRAYVIPDTNNSALYISAHWFIREVK